MDRLLASRLTREELDKHGLTNWGVRQTTDLSQAWLGMCLYKDRCIVLHAMHIDTHPDEEVIDTIKHEVAHAIVGPGHGHDEVWAAKAREIGCTNTLPCSHLSFSPEVIDAIRSGATVEISFEEEINVIRRPKYKITQLKDLCPDCGKTAVEKFTTEYVDRATGNTIKLITLQCFHIIKKIIPRGTPYETLVTNSWQDSIKECKHEWVKNQCSKCGEFKLFDFQSTSALFLEKALSIQKGAVVAHEMGLGKTLCALAYIYFHHKTVTPVLYVVKSGIKFQWFKEIHRILGPNFLPQVIATSKDYVFPGLKGYIISYDLLRTFPREKLEALGIKLVVMDECQQIKNVDSGRTQAVRKFVNNPEVKVIGLSGTPWKNRGSEYFPILNMVSPTKFNSHANFIMRWVEQYWDGGKKKEGGIRNIEAFKEYVKDIVIRYERIEVAPELPLISRMKLHVQLDEISQSTYDEATSEFVAWYNNYVMGGMEDQISGIELLAQMARMRHISGLAKIPATEGFVEEFIENTDRKLVVFVHHKDVGQLLLSSFKEKYGNVMPVVELTGNMSSEQRFSVQTKFNDAKRAIMVASTLAAGEGLNLQTCADCVMHERQWNPANEEQAEGRFIRIGQLASAVNATYVEGENTIDTDLDAIVESKRHAFYKAMSNNPVPKWDDSSIAKELAQRIVENYKKKNPQGKKSNITAKLQPKAVGTI